MCCLPGNGTNGVSGLLAKFAQRAPRHALLLGSIILACASCSVRDVTPYWGVKGGQPLTASVAASGFTRTGDRHDTVFGQVALGLSGGKLSAGYGWANWEFAHVQAAKVSAVRTFGDPPKVSPDETLVGIEYEGMAFNLSWSVGVFWSLTEASADDGSHIFVEAGIGF
jgi:hypothetical protein